MFNTQLEAAVFTAAMRSAANAWAFFERFNESYFSADFAPFYREFARVWELGGNRIDVNLLNPQVLTPAASAAFAAIEAQNDELADFETLAGELTRLKTLRDQLALGESLQKAARRGEIKDIDAIADEFRERRQGGFWRTFGEWEADFNSRPPFEKIRTGIDFLDETLSGGFAPAQLVLVSGEPEAGKTALSTQIMENVAQHRRVGFFCFEFTVDEYVRRNRNNPFLKKENIAICNDGYDISRVAANIKEEYYTHGTRFFVIDSQLRLSNADATTMEEEETSKFSVLAKLCHKLGIVVLFIIQTSKTDTQNPMGSKKGGHEASIIIRIEFAKALNSGGENDENAREIKINKNKQTGKHFKERVYFDTERLRFSSVQRQVAESYFKMDFDDVD